MGGVLLDEKKQEKGKVPQNVTFPTYIERQRRPLGALCGVGRTKNGALPNLKVAPQVCYLSATNEKY